MPPRLEWRGRELKLGSFTVATVRPYADPMHRLKGFWECVGNAELGSTLRDVWQEEEDAKQDIRRDVKRILEAQGVEIDG